MNGEGSDSLAMPMNMTDHTLLSTTHEPHPLLIHTPRPQAPTSASALPPSQNSGFSRVPHRQPTGYTSFVPSPREAHRGSLECVLTRK